MTAFSEADGIDLPAYLAFLQSHQRDLLRIARHSRGEFELEDVKGEIWLIADALSAQLGTTVDFTNTVHQSQLLAYTYQKLVRYCETNVRHAKRMDGKDNDTEHTDFLSRLTNGDSESPFSRLAEESNKSLKVSDPVSLGGAWITVLDLCNNRMISVAQFLKISLSHSYRCFNEALTTAQTQQDLPLHVADNVASDPRPWRPYRHYRIPKQLAFEFDDGLPFA